MAKRHPNHRHVKIHRSYTVEEIAKMLGKHKNTVRIWVKDGLPTIDDKRPMLILGHDLVEFIKKRRTKNTGSRNNYAQLHYIRYKNFFFQGHNTVPFHPDL